MFLVVMTHVSGCYDAFCCYDKILIFGSQLQSTMEEKAQGSSWSRERKEKVPQVPPTLWDKKTNREQLGVVAHTLNLST